MKQIFNAAVICTVIMAACTTPFKKAKDGSEYKIISTKKGAKVVTGNYMEMSTLAKYKDSILSSSIENGIPQYVQYDTAVFPPPFKEIFKNVHLGDSIVIKMSTDSIIAKSQGQVPPFMKKGQFIIQTFTITNIYATKEQMDSAQKTYIPVAKARAFKKQSDQVQKDLMANKEQIEKDNKLIEDYLSKNNIKASKAKWGTYMVIQAEGNGEKIALSDIASVNYTGRTFDSSIVFDSNTDPKFNHVVPLDVNMGQFGGQGGVMLGWTDVLLQMKKGTKATVYIPSTLAYGKNGRAPEINPDKILVFDMEIVNVTSEEALMAQQEEFQKKSMEEQKRMMDSIQKASPDKKQ